MEIADCYRILGLRTGASYEDIKASYRRLARRYHPDANPTYASQAKEKFIQLTEAYRRLTLLWQSTDDVLSPATDRSSNRSSNRPSERSPDRSPNRSPTPPPVAPATPTRPPQRRSPRLQIDPNTSVTDRQLKRHAYEQLQHLLREQRFPRAIAMIEGLVQRLPNDLEVRQWQAITYQRFGRYLIRDRQIEKGRIYLQKALRADPHNKSLWYEVDRDLRQIGQVEVL